MNKKFLSAILFGALMVTSTGTFVSCKDYDDDIDRIDTELSDLRSQIAALQTEVSNGNWVTSLASVDGGFTVTFKNGNTYTIVNGKDGQDGINGEKGEAGEPGKDGNGTIVEVKDGYWYIDGEKTEFLAVTEEDLQDVKVPYVNDNNMWVFFDEDGKEVVSKYNANGAAYAVKASGVWTLNIPDANGEMQSIELPGAGSAITSLTVNKLEDASDKAFVLAHGTAFKYDKNDSKLSDITDKKNWGGSKAIPANGSVVYTSPTKYDMRVNPVSVDAKLISYTLTNTKNSDIPYITLKASEQDEMFTIGNINARAAQGNGLYRLSMDNFVLTESQAYSFNYALSLIDEDRVHAVNADHAFRSAYDITVEAGTAPELTQIKAKNNEGNWLEWNVGTAKATAETIGAYQRELVVDLNSKTTIYAVEDAAMYDMFIYIPAEYASSDVFNVEIDQANHSFVVKRNPDSSTLKAWFPMYVYTVDINGNLNVVNVKVRLSSKINRAEYGLHTHAVTSNPNLFQIDLSTMYTALGNDLNTWKINVKLSETEYKLFAKYENGSLKDEIKVNVDAFTELIVKEVKSSNTGSVTAANDAKFIQVNVRNDKATYTDADGEHGLLLDVTYYLSATFKSADEDELNTIVVPVKFTAPTVADQFTVKDGYVKDGAINAYFYDTEATNIADRKVVELTKYFSKFDKVSSVYLNWWDKVGQTDKTTNDLAVLNIAANEETVAFNAAKLNLKLIYPTATSQFETGYGETLNVFAYNTNYNDTKWEYSNEDDMYYFFDIRLMSPIEQGSIKPLNSNTITISGNELVNGAKITDEMIMGYDYNNNTYNVVPDGYDKDHTTTPVWANPQVVSVTPGQDDDKYIKSTSVAPATLDKDGKVVNGNFVVKGESISQTVEVKMPITVLDAWGYTKTEKVSVTIQKN